MSLPGFFAETSLYRAGEIYHVLKAGIQNARGIQPSFTTGDGNCYVSCIGNCFGECVDRCQFDNPKRQLQCELGCERSCPSRCRGWCR